MPIQTPNSTKPSNSSPGSRRRRHRRRPEAKQQNKLRADVFSISCGGIVYRRKNGDIEIFFIRDPFQRWTFPKGKQERGETYVETAVREIREETGLEKLKYVAPLGRTSFKFRREVGVIQKAVHYFLFEAPPDAEPHFAKKEELEPGQEPILEGKWVPLTQSFSISSYKNSDHLLVQAFRVIFGKSSPQSGK